MSPGQVWPQVLQDLGAGVARLGSCNNFLWIVAWNLEWAKVNRDKKRTYSLVNHVKAA